jgi:hypothetical protein
MITEYICFVPRQDWISFYKNRENRVEEIMGGKGMFSERELSMKKEH